MRSTIVFLVLLGACNVSSGKPELAGRPQVGNAGPRDLLANPTQGLHSVDAGVEASLSVVGPSTGGGTTGPKCGDGVLDAAESCDDGNTKSGDACSDDCEVEHLCLPRGATQSWEVWEYASNTNAIWLDHAPGGNRNLLTQGDATFTVDASGDARAIGHAFTRGNPVETWTFVVDFSLRGVGAVGVGMYGPHLEQPAIQPTSVTDTWTYYNLVSGELRNDRDGSRYLLVERPASGLEPFQTGLTANGKDAGQGGSGWFTWTHIDASGHITGSDAGDLNFSFHPPAACECGDGVLSDGETCDDGNQEDGDGCSATCQPELDTCDDALALAAGCNVLVHGDYVGGLDVGGEVCVGGLLSLTGFSVNREGSGGTAIVAGDLALRSGTVYGDAVYATSASVAADVDVRGALSQGTPIDFDAAFAALQATSAQLAALPENGTTGLGIYRWGNQIALRGSDPVRNVFTVPASVIDNAVSFNVDVPAGSLVIINVPGTSASFSGFGLFLAGADADHVLFNLPDATALEITNFGFVGSVLAPRADATFVNGSFDGQVIVGSLTGTGEPHAHLFAGDLCP
jgi:choice-of-anchor A domain-containing protein